MNLTPVIITGIVFMLVGIAIGSLVTSLTKDAKEKPSPPKSDGEWIECVSLVRDKEGKNIFPQFQGNVIQKENKLSVQNRQTLVRVVEALRTWLGEPAGVSSAADAQTPTPAATQPTIADVSVVNPELLGQPVPPPAAKPSVSPIEFFAKAIQLDVKPAKMESNSIVVQIDEILQEKLPGTPLEKRGIRLVEFPGKGMAVMVGFDQYEGVDEVPEEEIRQIIRSAVKEWEDRLESSL